MKNIGKNVVDNKKLIYVKKYLQELKMNNFINNYSNIKKKNMYNPSNNNFKFLTIIASHVYSKLKFDTVINNVKMINSQCNDIIIINSKGLPYNKILNNFCNNKNIKYIEVFNQPSIDFGKWLYVLKNNNYSNYDFVIFMNDSVLYHKPIHFFYNLIGSRNVELYGYNDSTQVRYHYQSYLFSVKKDAINKFIQKVESKILSMKTPSDVINNYELQMTDWFLSKDCFLKIGNEYYNKSQNIFFTNDVFYSKLFNNKLLNFSKIKRILRKF